MGVGVCGGVCVCVCVWGCVWVCGGVGGCVCVCVCVWQALDIIDYMATLQDLCLHSNAKDLHRSTVRTWRDFRHFSVANSSEARATIAST